jgi:hypothetical protein
MLQVFSRVVNFLAKDELHLVVMSDGMIGRTPRNAAMSDRVAVIAGVPSPLILRPCLEEVEDYRNRYQVVGPIFIHDWMDGSAFPVESNNIILV